MCVPTCLSAKAHRSRHKSGHENNIYRYQNGPIGKPTAKIGWGVSTKDVLRACLLIVSVSVVAFNTQNVRCHAVICSPAARSRNHPAEQGCVPKLLPLKRRASTSCQISPVSIRPAANQMLSLTYPRCRRFWELSDTLVSSEIHL